MKILAFLISDIAKIDEKTGKLSIEGIFNSIGSESFPARHKELMTTLIMEDATGNHQIKISIIKDGKEIAKAEGNIKTGTRHYHIVRFNDVVFLEEGEYTVIAEADDQKISTSIKIVKLSPTKNLA